MIKLRKSKAENGGSRGRRRGVCHTEHALCANFLLSSSSQKGLFREAGSHHRLKERRGWIQLRRIHFKLRNYYNTQDSENFSVTFYTFSFFKKSNFLEVTSVFSITVIDLWQLSFLCWFWLLSLTLGPKDFLCSLFPLHFWLGLSHFVDFLT